MGNSLIGTTDTDYDGSPDDIGVDQEDVDYLFRELRRIFPEGNFKKDKIITMFAGLRPLVYKCGAAAKVSRKHAFKESYSGITYVMGGKYTTYRKMAEDCVKKVFPSKQRAAMEQNFTFYGGGTIEEKASDAVRQRGVSTATVQYLMDFYGARYKDVLDLIRSEKGLAEPICSCSPVIRAQILYAVQVEMAVTEEDIYKRRLPLMFVECKTGHCRKEIQHMISKMKTLFT
jgi:glycerol-3-phosphate dehydrogenase